MPTDVAAQESTKKRGTFDQFVVVLGVVESLTTLPQLYQIWIKHQIAGVSVITWISYSVVEGIWLAYGLRQKDRAVVAASLSWGIMEILVAIGAIVK